MIRWEKQTMAAGDARDDTAYLQDHGSGREQRHPQWRARWGESDPELDYVLDPAIPAEGKCWLDSEQTALTRLSGQAAPVTS